MKKIKVFLGHLIRAAIAYGTALLIALVVYEPMIEIFDPLASTVTLMMILSMFAGALYLKLCEYTLVKKGVRR